MDPLESILGQMPNILRLVVSAVLLLSGFSKLLDTADFTRVLTGFRAVPSRIGRPLAVSISVLELVVGAWLALGGRGTNAAASVASGLLVVFAVVIASTLLRGNSLECGCFGRIFGGGRATWRTVGRNAILAAMAVAVALGYDTPSAHVVTGMPALLVLMAGVVGAIVAAETFRAFRSEPMRRHASLEPATGDADPRPEPSWPPNGAEEWMGSGSSPI